MELVLSKNILKREFGSRWTDKDLAPVIGAFVKGLYQELGGFKLWPGHKLHKVYSTTDRGARRTVFMVDAKTGDGFFLFHRDKNDDIGKNVALGNPAFKKELNKYLGLLAEDIAAHNIEIRSVTKKAA